MVVIKAKYANGRIVLPPDVPRREPCEVTVLFPEAESDRDGGDRERFRRAAGSWADMDTEKLIADIYAARRISTRKPPEL